MSGRDVITFGGRKFRVEDMDERTVENDHFLMRAIRASGVDKMSPEDKEGHMQYLIRLQTALLDSGQVCNLLGGYLLPDGMKETDWSPEVAADTAAFIAKCNTARDRDQVLELAAECVFGFFKRGLDLLNAFRVSGESEMDPVTRALNETDQEFDEKQRAAVV